MKLLNPVAPEDLAAVRAWFDALSKHCRAIDGMGVGPSTLAALEERLHWQRFGL